jgi:hypothetical protein
MQAVNNSSVFYYPAPAPKTIEEIPEYLAHELRSIQAALDLLAAGHLDKSYAAPAKPRDGDFRYADGTTWNPGSGTGFYRFDGTNWILLG